MEMRRKRPPTVPAVRAAVFTGSNCLVLTVTTSPKNTAVFRGPYRSRRPATLSPRMTGSLKMTELFRRGVTRMAVGRDSSTRVRGATGVILQVEHAMTVGIRITAIQRTKCDRVMVMVSLRRRLVPVRL
jgi:hypothetical protein